MNLYEQIKDDLGYLQLERATEVFATLAEEARHDDMTHIEFLGRLIAEQASATRNRRLTARLRYARFPFRKTIDEFDFEFQPSIDRKLVDDLATLRFMETGRPVLFLGQPGCGKTHLAIAIAILAVESGVRGYFTNAEDMVGNIAQAIREGTLASKLKTYTSPSILVIDDVGLLPMERSATSAFYQIVNQRYIQRSSRRTGPCPIGAKSSETPSLHPRSWTASCTTLSCSTSKAHHGGYASTTRSRPPPPKGDPTNITN